MLTFILGLLSLTGCRLCTDCEDEAYPTYGGIWQRTDRSNGRVGSVFAPAGAQVERPASLSGGDDGDDGATASEEATGDEDDFEVLPPGSRRPSERQNHPLDNGLPPDDAEFDETDDAEMEEVRLQEPLGNPRGYIGS